MFSKLLELFWPIKKSEVDKFIIMVCLMFLVLVNQNIVRNVKDSLVVKLIGAESLSFIKLWVEVPVSIGLVFLYTKLCNVLNQQQVFRFVVIFFLSYFLLFFLFLFPNREFLHPDASVVNYLVKIHPHWKWFIRIWGNWIVVSFYVMSELWPIIVFSLLFWQLANNTTNSEQASRFYPCLSVIGQSNLLFSSKLIAYVAGDNFLVRAFAADEFEVRLKLLLSLVIISGIVVLLLHRILEMRMRRYPESYFVNSKAEAPVSKFGLRASIKLILSSRYLICLCGMVSSYSLSINLMEGLWLFKAGQYCVSTTHMVLYNARITFFIGIVALFCSMVGGYAIRRFGWLSGALLTPSMMILTGSLFFLSVLFQSRLEFLTGFGLAPIALVAFFGGMHSAIGKGVKYSIFDTTKEMAYIPLNRELKTKGKAAVEILSPKIGKAVGSASQAAAFFLFPNATYDDIAPFLMVLFISVLVIWIISSIAIRRSYTLLVRQENNI